MKRGDPYRPPEGWTMEHLRSFTHGPSGARVTRDRDDEDTGLILWRAESPDGAVEYFEDLNEAFAVAIGTDL